MTGQDKANKAILYSAAPPSEMQRRRFRAFLERKYGREMELVFREDDDIVGGFVLKVGKDTYDWTRRGRLEQFSHALHAIHDTNDIIPLLKGTLEQWVPEAMAEEIGYVQSVGDGIAWVDGLERARYGEVLLFPNGIRGQVQDLQDELIGCVLYDDEGKISEGDTVHRTGRVAGVPVGENFLGRVINVLGDPLDDLGEIDPVGYRQIESPAPGIIDRQPVKRPMETGILAIDSMFPIGRGQRELIIGDRQTGKTAIAVDTILNQRGKNVVCIYVAIGQKASSVAQIVSKLRQRGAMDYTMVVCATASEAPQMQVLAPYVGCAMGEYFMESGRDVLIVYDDLSKHAIAYRTVSLLLNRPPGREAYPGDVFYLHSRLLERSAHLSEDLGGGSMTALPIVETQAGDISAYIPTNIISITDGQIYLESELFFAGQRPAVNVGLSVSRVGGDAQSKAMKKAVGTLRLDLAQYREMEIFTQFASDLDDATVSQLRYGQGLMRMQRQRQYESYSTADQIIILVAALAHQLETVPVDEVEGFLARLLDVCHREHRDLIERIIKEDTLTQEDREEIIAAAKALEA